MERTLDARPGRVTSPDSLVMRILFVLAVVVKVSAAAAAAGKALALSSFVMPALHDLPAHEAVESMQYLTASAMPPVLWMALLGTGAYALCLVTLDVLTRGWRASPWLVLGTVCYLAGVVGVTVFGMWRLDSWLHTIPVTSSAGEAWMSYATAWAGFNNVRLLAASLACVCWVVAMVRR